MKGFWFALGCAPIFWLFVLSRIFRARPEETFAMQATMAALIAAFAASIVWFVNWCWT